MRLNLVALLSFIVIGNLCSLDIEELHPSSVEATSFLFENQNGIFQSGRLLDGDIETSYVESNSGDGVGTTITFLFEDVVWLKKLVISNGFQENLDLFFENGRVKDLRVEFFNSTFPIQEQILLLEDESEPQEFNLRWPAMCNTVIFTIISTYPGQTYSDTSLSEISFYGYTNPVGGDNSEFVDMFSVADSISLYQELQEKTFGFSIPPLGNTRIGFSGNSYRLKYNYTPFIYEEVKGLFSVFNNRVELYPESYIFNNEEPESGSLSYTDSDFIPVENTLEKTVFNVLSVSENELHIEFVEYDAHMIRTLQRLYGELTMTPLNGNNEEIILNQIILERALRSVFH